MYNKMQKTIELLRGVTYNEFGATTVSKEFIKSVLDGLGEYLTSLRGTLLDKNYIAEGRIWFAVNIENYGSVSNMKPALIAAMEKALQDLKDIDPIELSKEVEDGDVNYLTYSMDISG